MSQLRHPTTSPLRSYPNVDTHSIYPPKHCPNVATQLCLNQSHMPTSAPISFSTKVAVPSVSSNYLLTKVLYQRQHPLGISTKILSQCRHPIISPPKSHPNVSTQQLLHQIPCPNSIPTWYFHQKLLSQRCRLKIFTNKFWSTSTMYD